MQRVGLQLHLNDEGRVIQLSGPLRHLLAQQIPDAQSPHLLDYLMPHSALSVEGRPAEWQGQNLDLDFSVSPGNRCTCAAGCSRWAKDGYCS